MTDIRDSLEQFAAEVRAEFPLLTGSDIIYLDSAATQQKPGVVLRSMTEFYESSYANVHRALYGIAARATERFEAVRDRVAAFIGAKDRDEVVFTSGTTASINLLARGWGDGSVGRGDEIVLTVTEHHSNLVPWQLLADRTGATLRFVGLTSAEETRAEDIVALINERTKLVTFPLLSNVLGSFVDVAAVAAAAHAVNAIVAVDAAQAVAHEPIDVESMGADFVAFSAHKLFGPTGLGVLWGRAELLEKMPPVFGGGHMIERVELERSTFTAPPHRFEAGTPPIAEVIGFGVALDWVESKGGISRFAEHERRLMPYFREILGALPDVRSVGPANRQTALLAFDVGGVHPHDLAHFLDSRHICVRAGHHCAQPLLKALNVPALTRLSVSPYTSPSDAESFSAAMKEALRFFRS